jgi:hypothetical protein
MISAKHKTASIIQLKARVVGTKLKHFVKSGVSSLKVVMVKCVIRAFKKGERAETVETVLVAKA